MAKSIDQQITTIFDEQVFENETSRNVFNTFLDTLDHLIINFISRKDFEEKKNKNELIDKNEWKDDILYLPKDLKYGELFRFVEYLSKENTLGIPQEFSNIDNIAKYTKITLAKIFKENQQITTEEEFKQKITEIAKGYGISSEFISKVEKTKLSINREIKKNKTDIEKIYEILGKLKEHQNYFHNLIKEKGIFFSVNKKVSKETVYEFIKNYKEGRLINQWISDYNSNMKVFPITKSVLVTIRIKDQKALLTYLRVANKLYSYLKNKPPTTFDIYPVDIIDIMQIGLNKYAIIEKVHPVMSIDKVDDNLSKNLAELKERYDLYNLGHRYSASYLRLLNKIKNYELFKKKISSAMNEYKEIVSTLDGKEYLDHGRNNLLLMDYNENNKKILFGFIDFIGRYSSSF